MPTSPKRTKRRRKIRFPVLLLGICLLVGILVLLIFGLRSCSKKEASAPDGSSEPPAGKPSAELASAGPSADYSAFYGHKAVPASPTPVYRKTEEGFAEIGEFAAGALLDIGNEQEGNFLPVSGTDLYIDGASLTSSDRWVRSDTNLLPYDLDIVTADSYRIQDERGSLIATMNQSARYPILVKPGEDSRYGIPFMNTVAYIDAAEVSSEEQADRTLSESLASELPVLMYHFFYSEAEGGSRIDGNYVEVNELDEQLKYLSDNGFTACTMREVQYWMEGRAQLPYHSLAITIDDADPSVHQYAMPVFTKYGIHATNFVICGWQPPEMPYELWEMRENGMELQSHGFLTHTGGCSGMGHGGILLCMDHDAGVEDTRQSFDYVDGGFVYCYPFGDINENAESIVRDGGAKLAFTTEGGRIHPGMDPLALPRVRVTGGNGLKAYAASID